MSIFDGFKKPIERTNNYVIFSNWLNRVFEQELPKGIIGFNLYEGSDGTYHIQLTGSDEFDKDDSSWACTNYFTTGEDICHIKRTKDIEHWEEGLQYMVKLVERYLEEGRYSSILKKATGVGIGFVDGDINIVYYQ